jgi:hypothetical protein
MHRIQDSSLNCISMYIYVCFSSVIRTDVTELSIEAQRLFVREPVFRFLTTALPALSFCRPSIVSWSGDMH